MTALKILQDRAIQAEQSTGPEMFLGIPDNWYEPHPNWGCNDGHVSGSYIKSEKKGALCPACLKPVAMIPHGYSDRTLKAALAAIKTEASPTKGNGDTDKGIEDRSDEDWFFSPNDGD